MRSVKYAICVVFTVMFCAPVISGWAESVSSVDDLFAEGNALYEKAEYAKAIETYEKILSMGYESGALYFNMANAYFRAGNKGKAIVNYKRAEKLIPSDSDVAANERFIRSKIGATGMPDDGVWSWGPIRRYCAAFSADEVLKIFSGLFIAAIIMLAGAIVFRVYWRYLIGVSALLFLFAGIDLAIAAHQISLVGKEAVITSAEVEAKYGPFPTATVFFQLREGATVRIVQEKDDWCKVKRSDGKSGW
ncbi:MAG TPA: tetratricopeptide repeat protein, partial [Candidatus Omnitrophota bacterium]|nr:tetratricopeptide repeat protein [Candidatus Omnitrophota bacterium]